MDKDFIQKLHNSIKTTGFTLEYEINQLLEQHHWNVISNRYYEDDITNTPREIDLIAYKAKQIDDILYYYTLVISCKKTSEDCWVVYTKKYNQNELNTVNYPLLYWSNDKVLNKKLSDDSIKTKFSEKIENTSSLQKVYSICRNAFAFQQFDLSKAKKNNDKDIYNSITSIIKAAEYEKKHISKRKTEKCIYFFELVSILDGKLFEAIFEDDIIDIKETKSAKYQHRFIISGTDSFYRIEFTTKDNFSELLDIYDDSKNEIWNFLDTEYHLFYSNDIYQQSDYLRLYLSEMSAQINTYIKYVTQDLVKEEVVITDILYSKDAKQLEICISCYDDEVIEKINNDDFVRRMTERQLKLYYRYTNTFVFTNNIPF